MHMKKSHKIWHDNWCNFFQNNFQALPFCPRQFPGSYLSVPWLSCLTLSFQTQTHKGLLHLHPYPWMGERHISISTRTRLLVSPAFPEQLGSLHCVYCVLNDLFPPVTLFFGAGMHFHHFRIFYTHADQEQTLLFVSHFSYNQLLQRDHSGFLVLQMERNGWGGQKVRYELTFRRSHYQYSCLSQVVNIIWSYWLIKNYSILTGSHNGERLVFLHYSSRKSNFTLFYFNREVI